MRWPASSQNIHLGGYNGNVWQGVSCYKSTTNYGLVGNCFNPANQYFGNRAAILEKATYFLCPDLIDGNEAEWDCWHFWGCVEPHRFKGRMVLHEEVYENAWQWDYNSVELIIRVSSYPNMAQTHVFLLTFPLPAGKCEEQRSKIASDVCALVIFVVLWVILF